MSLAAKLGELRGEYMAQRRREAYKAQYDEEPDFTSKLHPVSGISEDFVLASKLIDTEVEFAKFASLVAEALNSLDPPKRPT